MVCGYLGWAFISIYFSPLMHFIRAYMSLLFFSISRINIRFILSLLLLFLFCFNNGVDNNEYKWIENSDEGNENASKIIRKHWHFRWCIVCIFSLNRPWPEENVYQLRYTSFSGWHATYMCTAFLNPFDCLCLMPFQCACICSQWRQIK